MDIVWFAEIKWDYLKTRKQQIITRKPDDIRLLFIEPYVKGRENRFTVYSRGDILCVTVPSVKSVPPGMLRRCLESGTIRSWIDRYAILRTGRILKKLRFDRAKPGCILSNIHAIRVALHTPRKFLLYDCNDAHAAFPGMPDWSRLYFEETCRRADTVFVSSHTLAEGIVRARGHAEGVEYIGNGVDFERFRADDPPVPSAAPPGKIRVGYLGAIAPWFDFDSLALLADRRPEWSIVLVGPVLGEAQEELDSLTRLPNVTHRDAVPHEKVPSVLREFSVAVIPFRYGELTRGVNPNKLYEYLAVGLPVVATRFCREVDMFPDVVRTAEPGEPFVRACEESVALLSDSSRTAMRAQAIRIAKEHDWDGIAGKFWSSVRHMMEAKNG